MDGALEGVDGSIDADGDGVTELELDGDSVTSSAVDGWTASGCLGSFVVVMSGVLVGELMGVESVWPTVTKIIIINTITAPINQSQKSGFLRFFCIRLLYMIIPLIYANQR